MENFLKVRYPDSTSAALQIDYSISSHGKLHTIECKVSDGQKIPQWLQLQKFSFVSIKKKEFYDLLFNEKKYDKNLDTLLFLDRVYAAIMADRKFKIS